ncbi:MAG: hypothetical protein A2Y63_00245, partial [Candidatus Riflebacteria bacterium RBG_13_59_9]
MVTFKINGRAVTVPAGTYILDPIRELGFDIPALCDYSSLEPYGACRLCIVEVKHPRWKGRTQLVTSCNYPAQEGLEVFTATPRVLRYRRQLFDMLLSRCPENQALRDLARKYVGISESSLVSADKPSDCILCGLCVRVCEERSTCVLGFRDRGRYREVFPPVPPEECVGCGACALVCPTDAIPFVREKGVWRVWDRDFTIPICKIDPELCRGCGSCEEACYFDVAQVKLYATGTAASFIDRHLCQGCGSCIAICPTGAIHQEVYAETELLKRVRELAKEEPRVVLFNCPRSP